jgi:vacuolar-type H+-ATPase subunit C/Vma6
VSPDLGDVATRARGLASHLLSRSDLERLARASGPSALARSLEALGYWPAPTEVPTPRSAVETIEAAIEHETERRLALLGRWLAGRRAFFAGVFEEGERRAIRVRLRCLAAGDRTALDARSRDAGFALPRRAHEELERASDFAGLVKALQRIRSPYAEPLREALRAHGEDLLSLELVLDRSFAERARAAAERVGGRLLAWMKEGIDVDNAWSAAAGQSDGFIDGGILLSRSRHASIAREPDGHRRRRQLAQVFARSPLSRVFEAPEMSLAHLESRALHARIAHEHRAGRLDPIGPSPILECVMRTRMERVDLRRISWGVAQGLSAHSIVEHLTVAA